MVKNKIKPILPCLKEKKRYLVFEIILEKTIETNKLYFHLNKILKNIFGVFAYSSSGIILLKKFFKNNGNSNLGIIKIDNQYLEMLKASFCLITKIDDVKIMVRTIKVYGSIKKASNLIEVS
ncbi:MAG: Rpp14/Pop5 family protein [Candidatus Woesearchaeota archaeon]